MYVSIVATTTGDNMNYNVNCTDKAFDIWLSICDRWFDYDAMSHVTNKSYDLHLEIGHILRGI